MNKKPDAPARNPERRCVICGERGNKQDYLRVCRSKDGTVRVDRTGKAGGRGAYLCGSDACVQAFLKMAGLSEDGQPTKGRPKKSGKMERALHLSSRMTDEQYREAAEEAKTKAKAGQTRTKE
ncbi:MAG: YlxR family protein [Clostridia bacterium]|nr:YlxR family protein [Clostridia bacterium]